MIFYHFTAVEYLAAIQAEGLTKGDVPTDDWFSAGRVAVWLTTDTNPGGHGLGEARLLTAEEREIMARWRGVLPPPDARFPDKRAVRITVRLPLSDRRLRPWPAWGCKHVAPEIYTGLAAADGEKAKTWFLYFGTIDPGKFVKIDFLRDKEKSLWEQVSPEGLGCSSSKVIITLQRTKDNDR